MRHNLQRTADDSPIVISVDRKESELILRYRQLWRELFLEVESEEQLHAWESRLAEMSCTCRSFYLALKSRNPPTFPLPFRWKYELKSAVNEKLGKPNISFEDACQEWNQKPNW